MTPADKARIRIAHIDDDEETRNLVSLFLGGRGMEILSASSAAEGLKLIVDKEPHLILLDIEMPFVNGFEVCARIRRNPKFKTTPIIMITGMSQMSHVEKAMASGATDYINKPFNLDALLSCVRDHLPPELRSP